MWSPHDHSGDSSGASTRSERRFGVEHLCRTVVHAWMARTGLDAAGGERLAPNVGGSGIR
jgi:hypothetical protein